MSKLKILLNLMKIITKKKKLHALHNNLPFLSERMKTEKVEKFAANLYHKTEYIIYVRISRKASIKSWINFFKSSKKVWLKPYIYMNAKLRKKAKNNFEINFFKLVNTAVFGKTMENIEKI